MPRYSLSRLVPLFAVLWAASAQASVATQPMDYYGERIAFDVVMDGDKIGEHVVTFSREDGDLRVIAETDLKVRFLVFTAYEFTYRSEALWRDGRLHRLSTRTDDDGEVTQVTARRADGALKIAGVDGETTAAPDLIATNHWNPDAVEQERLLNTITGRINAVTVEDLGEETVETGTGPRRARHYAYRGELEAEVWYDDAGRWVRLRFTRGKDRVIEYICRSCGGERLQASAR